MCVIDNVFLRTFAVCFGMSAERRKPSTEYRTRCRPSVHPDSGNGSSDEGVDVGSTELAFNGSGPASLSELGSDLDSLAKMRTSSGYGRSRKLGGMVYCELAILYG